MTGLLVSVRNATEAELAVRAGADLIDVKEPDRGALGRADALVWREVIDVVQQRRPVSVALGDLPELVTDDLTSLAGVTYAKIGLANCDASADWHVSWQQAIHNMPPAVTAVAVAYADWQRANSPPPLDILRQASEVGCGAILLDTFDKSAGNLLAHFSIDELAQWVGWARESGLRVVLAGSLGLDSIPTVLRTGADFVGVRGAICRGGRRGKVNEALIRNFVCLVREIGAAR